MEKKPLLFLIGNPDKLGFKPVDPSLGQSSIKKDEEGIEWYSAVIACCELIFTDESHPQILSAWWLDNALYQQADYEEIVGSVREISESEKLVREAEKDRKKVKQLLLDYPPATEYAIPELGTEARRVFTHFVKAFWKDIDRESKQREELKQKLAEIAKIYNV